MAALPEGKRTEQQHNRNYAAHDPPALVNQLPICIVQEEPARYADKMFVVPKLGRARNEHLPEETKMPPRTSGTMLAVKRSRVRHSAVFLLLIPGF